MGVGRCRWLSKCSPTSLEREPVHGIPMRTWETYRVACRILQIHPASSYVHLQNLLLGTDLLVCPSHIRSFMITLDIDKSALLVYRLGLFEWYIVPHSSFSV
jgi:hypothetical protein